MEKIDHRPSAEIFPGLKYQTQQISLKVTELTTRYYQVGTHSKEHDWAELRQKFFLQTP